ncbi:protein of unknown function (plasmid) [Magnetospirillum sp. XM-1]|nr:protein of unknown function [Magnetospirillum sp. XM-1]
MDTSYPFVKGHEAEFGGFPRFFLDLPSRLSVVIAGRNALALPYRKLIDSQPDTHHVIPWTHDAEKEMEAIARACSDPATPAEELERLLDAWPQPEDAPADLLRRAAETPDPFALLSLVSHPNLPLVRLAEAADLAVRWHDDEGRYGPHLTTKDLPLDRLAILAIDGSTAVQHAIALRILSGPGGVAPLLMAILAEAERRDAPVILASAENEPFGIADALFIGVEIMAAGEGPNAPSSSERLDLLSRLEAVGIRGPA